MYASLPSAAGEPPHRLVGWAKVKLGPDESKTAVVHVEPRLLQIFDDKADGWRLVPGTYTILVGASSRDLPLQTTIKLP